MYNLCSMICSFNFYASVILESHALEGRVGITVGEGVMEGIVFLESQERQGSL